MSKKVPFHVQFPLSTAYSQIPSRVVTLPLDSNPETAKELCTFRTSLSSGIKWCQLDCLFRIIIEFSTELLHLRGKAYPHYRNSHILTSMVVSAALILTDWEHTQYWNLTRIQSQENESSVLSFFSKMTEGVWTKLMDLTQYVMSVFHMKGTVLGKAYAVKMTQPSLS